MAVFYHGGGGTAKAVPCGLCAKPMYHDVTDPTTPACQACRAAKTYGRALTAKEIAKATSGFRDGFRRPSGARDEPRDDSEPQGTCKDHTGDYGPMCALCDDDRARYRAWRKSHEL